MRYSWTVVVVTGAVLAGSVGNAMSQTAAAPAVKYRTAVIDLQAHNQMPDDDITEVTTKLYQDLKATGTFDVIDRAQTVQAAGGEDAICRDENCAASIGRTLGAAKVIFGDVTKVEIIYHLTLTIVDVASGSIERTHVEKVAGHMGDVAGVGVKCAIDALLEPPKVSDYKKGDWKKVRAHGMGGRVMVVLPSYSEPLAKQRIPILPTASIAVKYDAQFRMKNGMEIHYTPSIEYWTQSGDKGGEFRVHHLSFDVADFRWFFASPAEKDWVFYLGLGPAFSLYIDRDDSRPGLFPPDSAVKAYPELTANAMAGLSRQLPKSGWMLDIGFRATMNMGFQEEVLDVTTFSLGVALTRPFKPRKKDAPDAGEAPQEEPALETESSPEF